MKNFERNSQLHIYLKFFLVLKGIGFSDAQKCIGPNVYGFYSKDSTLQDI
jgi:hypothetical protein